MLSAPRDAADQRLGQNKNRGTQVVKLSVPFLFHLPTVPYQSPVCRAADAEQTRMLHPAKKKRVWNGGTERLQTLRFLVQRG